jgi:hypothetical protein
MKYEISNIKRTEEKSIKKRATLRLQHSYSESYIISVAYCNYDFIINLSTTT